MTIASLKPESAARILLVEDDPLQSGVLQSGLTAAGYDVEVVASGLVAVSKIHENRYDIALIDYNIPDLDGLAGARLVADFMGQLARPILIALTGTPERLTSRETGVESAFDAILTKPCDFKMLVHEIERHLAAAPDPSIKRAAANLMFEQAWEDYFMGPGHSGENEREPGPARILVVEDDDLQQLLLVSALEARGYDVEVIANGLDAVRRIRTGRYDLVLIDDHLPELDGIAAAKLVHDLMAQSARPRLIALTALGAQIREKEAHADLLFDEIVEKPTGLVAMLSAVDRQLRASPNPATRRVAEQIPAAAAGQKVDCDAVRPC